MENKFLEGKLRILNMDIKNRKIMDVLRMNSRLNEAEIAKMVYMSRESVHYRIEKMKKEGILREFLTFFDPTKLGYERIILFVKYLKLDRDIRNALERCLSEMNCIEFYMPTWGEYDALIEITGSKEERKDALNKIWTELAGLASIELVNVAVANQNNSFFGSKFKKLNRYSKFSFQRELTGNKKEGQVRLDKTDKRILEELDKNSRIPIDNISRKIGLSAGSVYNRIKYLVEANLITGFRSSLDVSSELNLIELLIQVKDIESMRKKIYPYFYKKNFVYGISEFNGNWQFMVGIAFEDFKVLNKLREDLFKTFDKEIIRFASLHQDGKASSFFNLLRDY